MTVPLAPTVPPPPGRDSPARKRARAALVDVLWTPEGERRLPTERALAAALAACTPDDAWWVCEASSAGPVYLLPTREWVRELARFLARVKAHSVIEVAAGDGFLSKCLRAQTRLRVVATDDGSWRKASARQSARDKRELRGVPFAGIKPGDVVRMSATKAVRTYAPDVVIVSWAPPGLLVERAIRGPCKYVLDICTDGDVCGNGMKTWRFHKEFLDDTPLATRALCRLDGGAAARGERSERKTRVTLYYGARHREHGVDELT